MNDESKTPLTPCYNCGVPSAGVYCVLCDPYRDMPETDLRALLHEKDAKLTAQTADAQAMEADKARLDWLFENGVRYSQFVDGRWRDIPVHNREAIDAALAKAKEAK